MQNYSKDNEMSIKQNIPSGSPPPSHFGRPPDPIPPGGARGAARNPNVSESVSIPTQLDPYTDQAAEAKKEAERKEIRRLKDELDQARIQANLSGFLRDDMKIYGQLINKNSFRSQEQNESAEAYNLKKEIYNVWASTFISRNKLRSFIIEVANFINNYKSEKISVTELRRTLEVWYSKLEDLKRDNVAYAKLISTAQEKLSKLYENKSDVVLMAELWIKGGRWWKNLISIFNDLQQYMGRSFIRITNDPAGMAEQPGYALNYERNRVPNEYEIAKTQNDPRPVIKSIITEADVWINIAKNASDRFSGILKVMSLLSDMSIALKNDFNSLINQYEKNFIRTAGKSVKINIPFLKRDKGSQDSPDKEEAKRIEAEIKKAVQQISKYIPPDKEIYGSRIDAGPNNFRQMDWGEAPKNYELKKKLYNIWANGLVSQNKEISERLVDVGNQINNMDITSINKENFKKLVDTLKITYIKPSIKIYGTYVTENKFRDYYPDIDLSEEVYKKRRIVWIIYRKAFVFQENIINGLRDELKNAATLAASNEIPDSYEGSKISDSKFREFDERKDIIPVIHTLKSRIWLIYHQAASKKESDFVTKDFQKFYTKLIDFIDRVLAEVNSIINSKYYAEVLSEEAKDNLNRIFVAVTGINNEYTNRPWDQTFINASLLIDKNKFTAILELISNLIMNMNPSFIEATQRLNQEISILSNLRKTDLANKITFTDGDPFWDKYKDVFPKDNSPQAIRLFLKIYLSTELKGGQLDIDGKKYDYGIANAFIY